MNLQSVYILVDNIKHEFAFSVFKLPTLKTKTKIISDTRSVTAFAIITSIRKSII